MEALFTWLASSCLCDVQSPEGYAREPDIVIRDNPKPLPVEAMMQLAPLISVQDFSQLRATSRQPTSAGEKAFQELIKLPEKRRQQIRGVERVRSVEEWAEIAVTKADYSWHGFSTQGVMNDIRGKPVVFTKRGSMFDGWAEYFLLASPAELKSADILFAKPRSYM
ncbi:unnamed protein product [Symbiodinium pilosum]|uniref:Uncharacterized protein n=1 Tax=Symbiodinium pilosum TaxID=2952 RepID=A0A812N5I5_SYMPI|nr:unnamed protein product [Symbiodinium pilosum]